MCVQCRSDGGGGAEPHWLKMITPPLRKIFLWWTWRCLWTANVCIDHTLLCVAFLFFWWPPVRWCWKIFCHLTWAAGGHQTLEMWCQVTSKFFNAWQILNVKWTTHTLFRSHDIQCWWLHVARCNSGECFMLSAASSFWCLQITFFCVPKNICAELLFPNQLLRFRCTLKRRSCCNLRRKNLWKPWSGTLRVESSARLHGSSDAAISLAKTHITLQCATWPVMTLKWTPCYVSSAEVHHA